MKTQLVVGLAVVTCFASALGAQSVCSLEHSPDRVRVRLIGDCRTAPDRLQLRIGGDNRSVLVTSLQREEGYWEGKGFDSMIKSVRLCSYLCGVASSCASGEPTVDRDANGTKICIAEYEFSCEEPGWTLRVTSAPLVTFSYTRRRRDPDSIEQRGELKAAPGQICDLAMDEEVKLKPKVKPYNFRDIPVSRAGLAERRNSWTLGASELLQYVELPPGRRAQTASDAESAFVQQYLKELKLTIVSEER